jgi:3-phosphoshikimate 1-carboxyvinyltransferase
MQFGASEPLHGTVRVPGDKSISHRSLILAALARGRSRIIGLSDGSDVAATRRALAAMGARFTPEGADLLVDGVGTGALLQPERALHMGNSGTSARLLAGLVATHPITATFTGDESLSRRPMKRIADPLRRLGAEIVAAPGDRLPMTVRGIAPAAPIVHRLALPSAQVKSALLLAALNATGISEVVEPVPTRDHLERMLPLFGAQVEVEGNRIRLLGQSLLRPAELFVPGDPSAAAFLAVAALTVPGSELRIQGVCVNPRRMGLFEALREMGGDIALEDGREVCGEPVADILVRHSALHGIDLSADRAPAMIDEFPIFFIAAAFAQGTSRARGLAELRVKESDRLAAMAEGLAAIGTRVELEGDDLVVHGSGGVALAGGALIRPRLDHRIAMSFAVAGLRARQPVGIDDMAAADTSFPGFADLLARLGAKEEQA